MFSIFQHDIHKRFHDMIIFYDLVKIAFSEDLVLESKLFLERRIGQGLGLSHSDSLSGNPGPG